MVWQPIRSDARHPWQTACQVSLMRRIITIFVLLCLSFAGRPQTPVGAEWDDLMELLSEQGYEENASDLSDLLCDLALHPANLNDSTQAARVPLLDGLLLRRLRAYIDQYGPLLSVEELHGINGFDSITISRIRPFVCAAPVEPSRTLAQMLEHGRHDLLLGGSSSLQSTDPSYEGGPLRVRFRYAFHYLDRIQLQLSGENDEGEAFFRGSNPQGFDHYGASLALSGFGPLRRFVAGRYRVSFGQGLTLWSGLSMYGGGTPFLCRHSEELAPASAFLEYGSLNGAAATLALSRRIELTAFYSLARRDSLPSSTGYHRTPLEIRREDRLKERLYGANLQYNTPQVHLGATIYDLMLSLRESSEPLSHNLDAGVDASVIAGGTLFWGEFSLSQNLAGAGIVGLQRPLWSDSRFCAYYRHYSPHYENRYSRALGQDADNQNEEGLCLVLQTPLGSGLTLQSSADLFRFPEARYRVDGPSHGAYCRLMLQKHFRSHRALTFTYRYKSAGRNGEKDDYGLWVIEQTHRHQMQGRYEWTAKRLKMVSQAAYTFFESGIHPGRQGWLLAQDVRYGWGKWDLMLRGVYSDVEDYDARIYLAESDLPYEYGFPAYSRRGMRGYMVVRWKPGPVFSVAARYSVTYPLDEVAAGPSRMAKIQLRWKF